MARTHYRFCFCNKNFSLAYQKRLVDWVSACQTPERRRLHEVHWLYSREFRRGRLCLAYEWFEQLVLGGLTRSLYELTPEYQRTEQALEKRRAYRDGLKKLRSSAQPSSYRRKPEHLKRNKVSQREVWREWKRFRRDQSKHVVWVGRVTHSYRRQMKALLKQARYDEIHDRPFIQSKYEFVLVNPG